MQITPTSARRAPTPGALTRVLLAVTVALALVGAGCSGDDAAAPGAAAGGTTTTSAGTTVTAPDGDERPEEPVADLSEELTGGGGPFIGSATGLEVPEGYVEVELVAAGTATDYAAEGDLEADGRWSFAPDTSADYRTRVLIRRPQDPAAASGTVIVEWLNVSGGLDANPDYANLEAEIVRRGHTWVGVSAQLIGVEGGPVLVAPSGVEDIVGLGLRALDPDRYDTLEHPGDGYAFDIFTQVGRAVARGGEPLGGIEPDVVLAAGQSQSAIALTTYHNGVQPLTGAFDGFFIHSRAFATLPLVPPGEYADLTAAMVTTPEAVHLRTDLDVPVLVLQAEGDVIGVLNSVAARQDDNDRLRLWEVAGTAHADRYLLGEIADTLGCGVPINDGPMHLVAKAALASLDTWVRTGTAPPEAPRLDLTDDDVPAIARDDDGIALGGIRTPPVDVPAVVLSGAPAPDADLLCLLMGSTTPLADTRLAERYGSRGDYEAEYAAAADEAIAAGFVLAEDRDDLMGFARSEALQG
jgi:hypothetical protein